MMRLTGPRVRLALLVLPGLAAAACAPAAATYRWSPADTLGYHERTENRVTLEMPQGPMEIRVDHSARLSVAARTADTVQAWYDSLHLAQTVPGRPLEEPSTAEVLGEPFVLLMSPRGAVTTVTTPAFPEAIAAVTDLTHQFDDFFVTLPAGPLAPGVEWADTVVRTSAARPTDTYEARQIRRYRVLGDTVVDGERAVRLAVRSEMELKASSRMGGDAVTAASVLAGTDEGEAVFAPGAGRLLYRQRTGDLTGELTVEGAAGSLTWPQRYTYTSMITWAP